MPGHIEGSSSKRKRQGGGEPVKKRSRSASTESNDIDDDQSKILLLENEVFASKKHYNNITTLIAVAQAQDDDLETAQIAAVSLCRIFIRLIAAGNLTKRKGATEKEETVMRWLRERLSEYRRTLTLMLRQDDVALTALTLSMRLLKAEAQHLNGSSEYNFPGAAFGEFVTGIIQPEVDADVRKAFIEKFMDPYHDIRFYTFRTLRYVWTHGPTLGNLLTVC